MSQEELLSFYNKLEYFTPFELDFKRFDYTEIDQEEQLPWDKVKKAGSPDKHMEYTVYLGVFDYTEMNDFVLSQFKAENKNENYRNTKIVTASISINESGMYIPDSLGISTFAFGLTQLKKKNLSRKNWFEPFENILSEIKEECDYLFNKVTASTEGEFQGIDNRLNKDDIRKIARSIMSHLTWNKKLNTKIFILTKQESNRVSESKDGIIPTMFSQDLERVISSVKSIGMPLTLKAYLNAALNQHSDDKIDVNQNPEPLKESLLPFVFPDGCWPSAFRLSLMQQFAVNEAIKNLGGKNMNGIYAVNGPPGSGKTTLIRDIIAANIVERAKQLINYSHPFDAFQKPEPIETETGFKHHIYEPTTNIAEYGMVVASSNNGAVENISKQLPRVNEVKPYSNKISYFKQVAQNNIDDNHWGLFSAVLGKSKNRSDFFNAIQTGESSSLKNYIDNHRHTSLEEWRDAKKRFKEKLKEVKAEKKYIHENSNDHLFKEEIGEGFADEQFWKNFKSDENQKTSPWYSEKLKKIQSELFIEALNLQETFILSANNPKSETNSNIISTTLATFYKYQERQIHPTQEQALALWQTFFLVVPVISTTFAALGHMFKDLGKESLPWLIVDEAGQALPRMAVGALWRSKRAVVIGDPLQIEPVNTIPPTIIEHLGLQYGFTKENIGISLSVQSLADRTSRTGSFLGDEESGKVWVGTPLKVHRRCAKDIFNLANKIAYNNSMVFATNLQPTELKLKSAFVHCEGVVTGKHFVQAQAVVLFELLFKEFQRTPVIPDLFIISPFTEVVDQLRFLLRKSDLIKLHNHDPKRIKSFIRHNIGSVHTFQGKEAEGVILCLGLDKTKMGAASWASEKPNILNVALTRAKNRFIAIGDKDVWLGQKYFRELKEFPVMDYEDYFDYIND